jgi:hypothetical protein
MADRKRINGNIVSWASIRLTIDGEVYSGFVSLSFADKRERVKVYGMGKHGVPRARTRGKYSTDPVKLKGPKSTIEAMRQQLAKRSDNGASYGEYEFPIVAQYLERGDTPMNVELLRCVYVGTSESAEEGSDPTMEEVEIDTMAIVRNGKTLFDSSEGAPL